MRHRLQVFLLSVILLLGALPVSASPLQQVLLAGSRNYQYGRTITIDHNKVPTTDQTNFPVLFSGTYAYLATVANGGNVTNANGYDIIFTSDAAGVTKLNHEIETYTAASGLVNFWVRVPTVATASNTVIYLWYSNSAITTSQENVTGVWDANYGAVYHAGTYNDSTANAKNAAGSANTSFVAGKIGNAMNQNGNGIGATISTSTGDSLDLISTSRPTIEMWIKSSATAVSRTFEKVGVGGLAVEIYNGWADFGTWGGETPFYGDARYSDGAWHHLVFTYDGTNNRYYIDGALVSTQAVTATWTTQGGNMVLSGDASYHPAMVIEEVRVSKALVRSANWITTEYNNQSSPSTFYTVGSAF